MGGFKSILDFPWFWFQACALLLRPFAALVLDGPGAHGRRVETPWRCRGVGFGSRRELESPRRFGDGVHLGVAPN